MFTFKAIQVQDTSSIILFNRIATYVDIGNSYRAVTKSNIIVHFVNNIVYRYQHANY